MPIIKTDHQKRRDQGEFMKCIKEEQIERSKGSGCACRDEHHAGDISIFAFLETW
jgi:hypothetical protein